MIIILEKELQSKYNEQTGKNAIWRAKETKGYLEWKKKQLSPPKSKRDLPEARIKAIADEIFR